MPKISIITTTYKHEKFIAKTIDSVLGQSFVDWELLIGDDSPDNATWNIIQEYVVKYPNKIKAWHHFPNKGIVHNMNFLMQQISRDSSYIAFLEGDDIYMSDHLERKIDIWKKYPELGLVYNELSTIDENGNIIEKKFIGSRTRKWYKNETDTIGKLLVSDMICFSYSTLMVRKYKGICIRDLGLDSLMGSETDLWVQIASRSSMYGIEESLTLYRKHQSNTSKDPNVTIGHYEYLVNYYYQYAYIEKSDLEKLQILISLMRIFVALGMRRYSDVIGLIMNCFRISYFQTLIIGCRSFYYRLIKPMLFSIICK